MPKFQIGTKLYSLCFYQTPWLRLGAEKIYTFPFSFLGNQTESKRNVYRDRERQENAKFAKIIHQWT
jgi:hypothetical protein